MAKNKKRKKAQKAPPAPQSGYKHSQAYMEACYATAKRIIRAIDGDEKLLDAFTKRQKQDLFCVTVTPPYVAAMQGHKVPRSFLDYIQGSVTMCLKRDIFDEELGVTWMEIMTVGQCLEMMLNAIVKGNRLPPPQDDVARQLLATLKESEITMKGQMMIAETIRISLMSLSQPNFRIYGLAQIRPEVLVGRALVHHWEYITTHECQSMRFTYYGKEHLAYRVLQGPMGETSCTGATIAMSKLFPDVDNDRKLDIYIQSHALHRLKERIDTLHAVVRNQSILLSLMYVQKVIRGADGRLYIAYVMPQGPYERTLGYFAFTIDGDNLIVLTFLPMFNERMPEGEHLRKRLRFSQEDLRHLGMDKLSFFYDVDIKQIPLLKQILFDELHLEDVRKVYSTSYTKSDPFNDKRTSFVKNFFAKVEERLADTVEDSPAFPVMETEIPENEQKFPDLCDPTL
ncbi:MAG: hypothetical protein LBS05_08425 [Tannerellaceae bacterium]|jgi:hypothetical protein|nr:hypothetical protein [Tannerellaceae bacterium]